MREVTRHALLSSKRIAMSMWALGALSVGAAVYVVDRRGDALFLPSGIHYPQTVSVFGLLGTVLPSMAHTFAFVVLSAVVWASTRQQIYVVCVLWIMIELVMEAMQLQVIAHTLDAWRWGNVPFGRLLVNYSSSGTFSLGDVMAIGIGALGAAGFLERYLVHEASHERELVATPEG